MTLENRKIIDALKKITSYNKEDRKNYVMPFAKNGRILIEDFEITSDAYCYLIWKSFDIEEHPEWKGEAVLKIIPFTLVDSKMWGKVNQVLEAQYWCYL